MSTSNLGRGTWLIHDAEGRRFVATNRTPEGLPSGMWGVWPVTASGDWYQTDARRISEHFTLADARDSI